MGDKTGIAWTDATWNPVRGCSLVSAGCEHCYAMRQAHRTSGPGGAYEGLTRRFISGPKWTGEIRTVPEILDQPLRWKRPRRIFVNSMSDLFHDGIETDFVAQVFAVMALASWHTFQVLTKRPARAVELLADPDFLSLARQHAFGIADRFTAGRLRRVDECGDGSAVEWPLWNVHLGVSVEDQKAADERVPLLLRAPAALRFLSCEPLLGPVDLGLWMDSHSVKADGEHRKLCVGCLVVAGNGAGLDWVILGGESGPRARPCRARWIRQLIRQCTEAEVSIFVKQMGARFVPDEQDVYGPPLTGVDPVGSIRLVDRAGADPSEWPEDLRVQQFPTPLHL